MFGLGTGKTLGRAFVSVFPRPQPRGEWETKYRLELPKDFDPNKQYSGNDLIKPYQQFVKFEPIEIKGATVFNYITRTGAFSDWPAWWKRS